jgi:hypothetical protein
VSLLADLVMYARFAVGLREFLRNPITPEAARALIRERLARREENFLRVLQRGIFEYPASPYRPLFRLAGAGLEDVRQMVRRRGLEPTLRALREAGVYVTFEECKGRQPIVRDGREFPVSAHDFDNPWVQTAYDVESGGSTGAGTRVHQDLGLLAVQASHDAVSHTVHGVLDGPIGVWRGVLPDGSGINEVLAMCRCGRPPLRWFTPGTYRGLDARLGKFRLAHHLTVLLGRAYGVPIPRAEHLAVEQAGDIARWAAQMVREHGKCLLNMVASRALRVSIAAQREGIDLTGVTFVIAGEPVTDAKVRGIRASGASYFTTCGFSEAGRLGRGCRHPVSSNDLHLMTDMCALITYPHPLPDGMTVPAFNVTTLLPPSPKILLNAESDDFGILEERVCGCPLEELGFRTHVREIRSFRKLTSEGVTMLGSEILHILEEVLPRRFGGSALDYQLIEDEDEQGYSRVSLAISPEVPIADEAEVIPAVLAAMKQESLGAGAAGEQWSQSGNLRIVRMKPVLTARGKLLPLYVARRHPGRMG